jgi:hypothetical protein
MTRRNLVWRGSQSLPCLSVMARHGGGTQWVPYKHLLEELAKEKAIWHRGLQWPTLLLPACDLGRWLTISMPPLSLCKAMDYCQDETKPCDRRWCSAGLCEVTTVITDIVLYSPWILTFTIFLLINSRKTLWDSCSLSRWYFWVQIAFGI